MNTDPADPFVQKYGGPHKITSIPDDLQIVRRGKVPGTHLEIVPKQPMTLQRFRELLGKIVVVDAR